MDKQIRPPFQAALEQYRRAKACMRPNTSERASERVVRSIDDALDSLMAVPSPSLGAFGEKIRILEAEYGLGAQPRHIGAIYADVAILGALYADAIFQAWPIA